MRNRYGLTSFALILTSAVTLTAPALAAPGKSAAHAPHYYVALGDSLSVGVQPDATGVNRGSDEGYPDQLHALLRTTVPRLRLVKLGCSGETTLTMMDGGVCRYPKGSQLAEAVAFLAHDRDVPVHLRRALHVAVRRFAAPRRLRLQCNEISDHPDGHA